MTKRYDRSYFDRWYRGPGGVKSRAELGRKVHLAVSAAERALDRPLRSVLDVGCGEGHWQRVLRKLRPRATYLGIDSSSYAVERYGAARGLLLGDFAGLAALPLDGPYDLVICADVLHYVPTPDLDAGLPVLAELTGAVAFLETYTSDDAVEGDLRGFQRRPAAFYGARFRNAGFAPLGLHCWAGPALADSLAALERAERPRR